MSTPFLKLSASMPYRWVVPAVLSVVFAILVVCCSILEMPLYYAALGSVSPPGASSTSIVGVGDWGCSPETSKTVENIVAKNPNIVLALGDFSYQDSADCWLNLVEPLKNKTKITIGNHDASPPQLLEQYMSSFGLEKQYYSFDYNNIHILAMSTELPLETNTEQFQFVTSDLRRASSNPETKWIIVFFHDPLYTSTAGPVLSEEDRREELRNIYHPIFSEYNVDIVLAGHNHIYERSYPLLFDSVRSIILQYTVEWSSAQGSIHRNPQGQIFVTIGTGGRSIFTPEYPPPYIAKQYADYGFAHFNLTDSSLNAEFYTNDGVIKDKFSILKSK